MAGLVNKIGQSAVFFVTFNYKIGPMFPTLPGSDEPNIIFSSDLIYNPFTRTIESKDKIDIDGEGAINTALTVTTKPFEVKGLSKFVQNYYENNVNVNKYLFDENSYSEGNYLDLDSVESKTKLSKSAWYQYYQKLVASVGIQQYNNTPRNQTLGAARWLGYIGPWSDDFNKTGEVTNAKGQTIDLSANGVIADADAGTSDDELYTELNKADNYDPAALFERYYSQDPSKINLLHSEYNQEDLEIIINEVLAGKSQEEASRIWYGTLAYSYGLVDGDDVQTSFPGPVLVSKRDDDINIKFKNQIEIFDSAEYGEEEALTLNAYATEISNKTGGHSGSDGHAGNNSTNIHMHGAHTYPGGFADNVVSRYTTGQEWETKFELAQQHGEGSYWYHPHYHPSVNQQVYAGMSGPIQIGDPLQHVPGFEDVPRNLAVLKSNNIVIDAETGEARLSYIPNGFNVVSNTTKLITVNGEYQPVAEALEPGWQSIAISNQTGQAYYNIQFNHITGSSSDDEDHQTLPMFVYGEDGWQYPQIQRAKGTLGSTNTDDSVPKTNYTSLDDTLTVAPGKRFDVLVYLPEGRTDMSSIMNFEKDGEPYVIDNMGKYPNQTSWDVDIDGAMPQGFGQLATFEVPNSSDTNDLLNLDQQLDAIDKANRHTPILEITPENDNTSNAVQRIRYFGDDNDKNNKWDPIRSRQSHWVSNALVGPEDEWDRYTLDVLNNLPDDENGNPGTYQRYETLTGKNNLGKTLPAKTNLDEWLSYDNPFLINDSLFPYAPITITQLETVEEWDLWNYSKNFFNNSKKSDIPGSYQKYVSHPFHIHINDYQVEDRDSAMNYRESLQDVSPLNSSGYAYYLMDPSVVGSDNTENIVSKEPVSGELKVLEDALDPDKIMSMNVSAANSQTVRMAFEDFKGVYVYHCHILPHEDQGMMIALMVVDNTDSSWVAPSQISESVGQSRGDSFTHDIEIYQAQNLDTHNVRLNSDSQSIDLISLSAGDLSRDGIQDVAIGSSDTGSIRIFDGASLRDHDETIELWNFKPFRSSITPWIFANDFNGDQHSEIVTAGFKTKDGQSLNISDLSVKGYLLDNNKPQEEFEFMPYQFIQCDNDSTQPVADLNRSDISVAYADTNVDNFNDIILAYRVDDGVRVSVIDGAALALKQQTGEFEGGYNPLSDLLADGVVQSKKLAKSESLNLEIGWNHYGQGALANIILSGTNGDKTHIYDLQVQAGHYIATSLYEPFHLDSEDGVKQISCECDTDEMSGMPMDNIHEAMNADSDGSNHSHHAVNHSGHATFPLTILQKNTIESGQKVFSKDAGFVGVLGNTVNTMWDESDDPTFVIPQGSDSNGRGTQFGSKNILASRNQLPIKASSLQISEISSDFQDLQLANTQSYVNQANLAQLIYTGAIANPTLTAILAADKSFTTGSIEKRASVLLENLLEQDVKDQFDGSLDSNDSKKIADKIFTTLFGYKPGKKDWNDFVRSRNLDESPQTLPYLIITEWEFTDQELIKINYLLAGMNWSNLQLGYEANFKGSFSLGINEQVENLLAFNRTLLSQQMFDDLSAAQDAFEAYKVDSISELKGTRITDATATELLVGSKEKNLLGGTGDDQLVGSSKNNVITANAGNDVLIGSTGRNVLDGGSGKDTARFGDEDNIVDLKDLLPQETGTGLDQLISIENLDGESGDDKLIGDQSKNKLYGRLGDDTLIGHGGTDRLYGGEGQDRLNGGVGDDYLFGGSDQDVFVASLGHDIVRDFELGQDRIQVDSFSNYEFNIQGGHLRIDFGNDSSLLLENVVISDFMALNPNLFVTT